MDIISYSQGKKAKKQVNKLNQHLGRTNEYKHGDQDIKDTYNTVDERITEMEQEAAPGKLNKKISELSANTMINLNKHNLKVDSLLNAIRYKHKNMIFDTFADDTTILLNESTNIKYNASLRRIELDDNTKNGTVVFEPQSVEKPISTIALSFSGDGIGLEKIPIPLDDSLTYIDFDLSTKKIKVDQQVIDLNGDKVDVYKEQAIIETPIIHLGNEISGINNVTGFNDVECYIAESEDGNTFTDYKRVIEFPVNCKPYIRLKFIIKAIESSIQIQKDIDFVDTTNGHFVGSLTSNLAPILKRKFDIDIDDKTIVNNNGIIVNSTTMQMNSQPYLKRKFNIHKDLQIKEGNIEDIISVYSVYLQNQYELI